MASATPSADNQCDEFARLYPNGIEAEDALDLVYDETSLSDYHRTFLHVQRQTRFPDSDSETSSSKRPNSPNPEYWTGYYSLSLQDPVENKTSVGWRMGKGFSGLLADPAYGQDQGVDLILIRPGMRSKQIAPVHARIIFHPRSGVLMLFGVESDRPVLYKTHDASTPLPLGQGKSHVLYQKSNLFWVGRLQYDLVFTEYGMEQYAAFVAKRNAVLYRPGASISALLPNAAISAVPRSEDVKRGRVITHGTIGYGAFGRVFPAVDAQSGEPLAVKQHLPTNEHHLHAIAIEVDATTSFKLGDGLLPTLGYWCEHDHTKPCNRVPQTLFTSSPLAIWDFGHVPWLRCSNREVLEAFCGPLKGLAHLHASGFMHRDVTVKNILVMSLNPIWAVLGDFGKALRAKTDQNISIGPAITCAPEVDGKTRYDNKIDVWSMGWAFMWVYMPNLLPEKSQPFNLYAWHEKVMGVLTSTLVEGGWYARLAELLTGMLALDPVNRISAAQALSQVYSLLASPPPQQAYLPLPQVSSQQKPSSEHSSELSQRDSRLDPGGCPFTITELVQEELVEASDKRARLL